MDTPLKIERERRGLTQNEVADAIGIDRSHYARIERAETGASPAVAKKIALHFGNAITRDQVLFPEDYVRQPELQKAG